MSEQIVESSQRIEVPEDLEAGVRCDCHDNQLALGNEQSFLVTLRAIKAGEIFKNLDQCPVITPPYAASFVQPTKQENQTNGSGTTANRGSLFCAAYF